MLGLFLRLWYSKGYVIIINITIIAIIISTTSQMTLKFRKKKVAQEPSASVSLMFSLNFDLAYLQTWLQTWGFVPVYAFSNSYTLRFVSSSSLLLYLACRQFPSNVFQGLHLLKTKKSRKHFQNCEFLLRITENDGNCCQDFVQFRHFRELLFPGFSIFYLQTAPA